MSEPNQTPSPVETASPGIIAKRSLQLGCLSWILVALSPCAIILTFLTGVHTSLVLEFLAFLFLLLAAPLAAIAAVIAGHSAGGFSDKSGNAVGGLLLGYSMLVLFAFGAYLLHGVRAAGHGGSPESRCTNSLKQLGLVFKLYATESKDHVFPELSPQVGRLAIWNKTQPPIYPEYLADLEVLLCSKPELVRDLRTDNKADPQKWIDKSSYVYLGYAITSEGEMEAFAEAYKSRIAPGLPFNEDLTVAPGTGNNGSDTIHRLREGAELFFMTNGESASKDQRETQMRLLPVLIERLGNHKRKGGNVLYLGGHVEFLKYPGKWPMTAKTMEILESLEALGKESASR